jgi:hypothetical protein
MESTTTSLEKTLMEDPIGLSGLKEIDAINPTTPPKRVSKE